MTHMDLLKRLEFLKHWRDWRCRLATKAKRTVIAAPLALLVATPALAQDKITLLLDWFINPDHGPIIVAEQLGVLSR